MSQPRLGQKLCLISKSSIRYEGTLSEINPTANTLTLADVTMFGTENRPAAAQVPRSDQQYEYIMFRGNDIKDLTVYDTPSKPSIAHSDPAIVSAGPAVHQQRQQQQQQQRQQQQQQQQQRHFQHHQPQQQYYGGGGGGGWDAPQLHHQQHHQQQGGWQKDRVRPVGGGGGGGGDRRQRGYGGGGGGGGGQRHRRGGKGARNYNYSTHTGQEFAKSGPGNDMPMEEFDFADMQKKVEEFEREKTEKIAPAYQKESGFFDSLEKEDKGGFGGGRRGGKGRGGRGF